MTIASEIERLQEAKSCIKCSIEDQGVSVPNNLKLQGYSECIRAIQSGGGYSPGDPTGPNMGCTYANGATDDWVMNLWNNTPRIANIRGCLVCDLPYNGVILLGADDEHSDYRSTYQVDILPIAFLNTVPNDVCSRYGEQGMEPGTNCTYRYQYVWKKADGTIDYTAHYGFSGSAYGRSGSAATEGVIPLW